MRQPDANSNKLIKQSHDWYAFCDDCSRFDLPDDGAVVDKIASNLVKIHEAVGMGHEILHIY